MIITLWATVGCAAGDGFDDKTTEFAGEFTDGGDDDGVDDDGSEMEPGDDEGDEPAGDGDGDGDDPPEYVCGDGIIDPGEQCDDGNDSFNDACAGCRIAFCGDGFVQAGVEECDDGNDVDTDDCITQSCTLNVCGDGITNVGVEACDDGNDIDTDDCPSTCEVAYCGDGFVHEESEDCDDANLVEGDGCAPGCVGELDEQCNQPYEILDDSTRNITYSGTTVCDSQLEQKWYRFSGEAGTVMPDWAPGKNQCGTHAPGWLNGEPPTVLEGVVSRIVCFNWSDDTCTWSVGTKVVNCGDHYLYELRPTPDCNLRYCGMDE